MKTKTLGWLSVLTLLFSVLWLVFLIASMATMDPLDTPDRVLRHLYQVIRDPGTGRMFHLTYINAALVTLAATALFAGLYRLVPDWHPTATLIGLVFVPIYAVMNLFVYLSQITFVLELARMLMISNQVARSTAAPLEVILLQLVQEWPESGMAFFNNLAYGILGIPSIVFGLALWRRTGLLHWGGALLALNGAACILGVLGVLAKIPVLSAGSLLGGVLFIASLPFIALALLRPAKGQVPEEPIELVESDPHFQSPISDEDYSA